MEPSSERASSRPEPQPAHKSRGERKFAVALFADLSGYTALCQRLDPEDVELTIAPLMASLRVTVEREGGVIANVAGDGFFAIFGVPRAYADAAIRAVRAGETMRDLVAERNAQPGLHRVPDVHVGVAAGEVLVSPSEDAPGWSVIGRAINLASRLCDAAGPGEVLVDGDTHRLVGAQSGWAGVRDVVVQGHDQPVPAWELKAIDHSVSPTRREVPFVNRTAILDQLQSAWESTSATGSSQVVTIAGDPGIGKSRVISHWLSEYHQAASLWLWCGGAVGSQSVLRLIDLLVGRTGEPTPDVRALLEAPTLAPATAVGADRFPMILETTRRLLARASSASPLVLVIDDLHAADATLHDAIADLRERPLDAPLLVLCTQRTGESTGSLAADIRLEPLPTSETEEIFAAALGAVPPKSVRDAVLSRVDGHPLMAVQSAAYLLESGVVTVHADQCQVHSPEAVDVLPTSLRLYVSARLDALPATEKAFIQELSTIGDAARTEWIRAVFGTSTDPMLDATAARGLLTQTDDGQWRFSHGLVQEVAYASLTRRARADLHRRQLSAISIGEQLELRAYHAVGWAQSIGAVGPASDAAAAVAALRETLNLARVYAATQARSAQELIHRNRVVIQDAFSTTPEFAVDLLTLNAQCLIELGRFDEALQSTTQADSLAMDHEVDAETRIRFLLVRGHALSRLRRYQSARQALDDADAIAEQIGNDSLRAQSLLLIADTFRHSDYARYVSLTEDAYKLFVTAADDAGATECARLLAYLSSVGPVNRYERWAAIAREGTTEDDVRGQAWLARGAQFAHEARQEYSDAEREALNAIEFGQRAGIQDAVMDGLLILILARIGLGRPAEAVEPFEKFIGLAESQNNGRARLTAGVVGAPALFRAGMVDRAHEELRIARDQVIEFGASELYQVRQGEAMIALDAGEWDLAIVCFDEVAAAVEESGATGLLLLARVDQARARLQAGQLLQRENLDHLRAECERFGAPPIGSMIDALDDRARLLEGSPGAPSVATSAACLEDLAIRAETAALRAGATGKDVATLWHEAAAAWQRVGLTIFLARAQASSGDIAAANTTLDALQSSEAAREWALSGPG